jgi:hypothetical protein
MVTRDLAEKITSFHGGNEFEFEKFNNDQRSKTSAQIILELCHGVEDKMLFPLSSFPCIIAR